MKRRVVLSIAALFALFLAGVGAFALSLMRSTAELQDLVSRHEVQQLRYDLNARAQQVRTDLLVSGTVFASDLDTVIANVRALDDSIKRCFGCHQPPTVARRLQQTAEMVERYKQELSYSVTWGGNDARRQALQLRAAAIADEISHLTGDILLTATPRLHQRTLEVKQEIERSWRVLSAALGATLLAALFVVWFITTGITRPLDALLAATREVSGGRVGYQIRHRERSEIGRVLDSFNDMSTSLASKEARIGEHIEHFRRLNRAVVAFHRTADRATLVGSLAETLRPLIDAEHCGTVLEKGPDAFSLEILPEGTDRRHATVMPVSRGTLAEGHRNANATSILVNRAQAADWPFGPIPSGVELRSLLVVWIRTKGEPMGALFAINGKAGGFAAEDESLLGILATGFSVALENLELYGDLRAQMEELSTTQCRLAQADKLTALGTLTGGIAHDFNNVLHAILGHTELLKDTETAPERVKQLTTIETAALHAGQLTRQLLAFSRTGNGKAAPVDVNASVRNVIELLGRTIDKRITVSLELEEPAPAIQGGASQFEQIVMNLCVNARDAMPEGGGLGIRTETVTLDEFFCSRHPGTKPGRYVRLLVSDTGTGIPGEILSRVFDPFFTTKDVGRGTGLGLSVVYGIVKGYGGACEIQSQVDRGTRFGVYLPAAARTEVRPPEARASASNGDGGILIAEDEEMVRSVLVAALEQHGYKTWEAADGKEAIEVLRAHEHAVRLVLLDVNMPVMDGLQAFRKLKEIKREIKVLVITGFVESHATEQILREGAIGLIRKPFTIATLTETVAKALTA